MSRHPADVRSAPPDVVFVHVKRKLVCVGAKEEVARRRVKGALGLSRRAGGVEDEEGILGIHRFRFALVARLGHLLMPPEVAARCPVDLDLLADPFHHDHLFDRRAFLQGRVGVLLLRDGLGAAEGPVADYENPGLGVLDPDGQRVRAETAEHHGMDGADPRTGQHRDAGLGDHRHVDADTVSLFDPMGFEDIREFADLFVEFAVRDGALFARLVADPLDRHLVAALLQLPIQAVVGNVQFRALEIFQIDRPFADIEVEILDLVPLLEEGQVFIRLLGPEAGRIGQEPRVELLVLLPAFDVRDFTNPLLYRIDLFQLYLFLFCHRDLPFYTEIVFRLERPFLPSELLLHPIRDDGFPRHPAPSSLCSLSIPYG